MANEAIFYINVQIERILIQKKKRIIITHLKKTRKRKIKVKKRVKARKKHTLFLPFENLFPVSILREFLERV